MREQRDTAKATIYACILAGGQQRLQNGPVAVVRYRIAPAPLPVPTRVRAENIIGVAPDLKKIAIPNAQGVITVQ